MASNLHFYSIATDKNKMRSLCYAVLFFVYIFFYFPNIYFANLKRNSLSSVCMCVYVTAEDDCFFLSVD